MSKLMRLCSQILILLCCVAPIFAQPTTAPTCCDRVHVVTSTDANCCSRLRIDSGCVVRSIKIVVTGGVFSNLTWNCSPAPINVAGQSSYTLIPASIPCKYYDLFSCLTATGAGIITVDYTVTFSNGTVCKQQDIKKCCCTPPIALPKSGCRGLPTTFKVDTSSCKIANGTWDFGDGSPTTTVLSPTHIYTSIGTFTATFTYDNACGHQKIAQVVVITQCPCQITPCFSYKITGLTVQFDGSASTSNYPIVLYHWDFGDGTWLNGVNPTHTYSAVGTYNVCLTVFVNNGNATTGDCSTKICKTIAIASTAPIYGSTCVNPATGGQLIFNPDNTPKLEVAKVAKNTTLMAQMTAFPNPFNDVLTVVFDEKAVKALQKAENTEGVVSTVEVYNLQGQLVKKQLIEAGSNEITVLLPSLPVGAYILSLRQNGQVLSTIKVTKN